MKKKMLIIILSVFIPLILLLLNIQKNSDFSTYHNAIIVSRKTYDENHYILELNNNSYIDINHNHNEEFSRIMLVQENYNLQNKQDYQYFLDFLSEYSNKKINENKFILDSVNNLQIEMEKVNKDVFEISRHKSLNFLETKMLYITIEKMNDRYTLKIYLFQKK